MKKFAIVASVIIVVAIISAYYFLTHNKQSSLPYNTASLVDVNLTPSGQLNATQGGVTSVNVTLSSLDINETTIPLSLVLQTYENERWDSSVSQNELFSSTFSLNPIVLKSNETKTSVLTLHVEEAAPIGKYTFLVELGDLQVTQLNSYTFDLDVAPSS